MKRKFKFRWYYILPVLLVGGVVLARRGRKPASNAVVQTAVAGKGDVRLTVSASGKLQPYSTIDVKSKAGGTVVRMAVEEGTRVQRGQLICLIDRRDTQAAYRQAQADVESARANVQQAEDNAQLEEENVAPSLQSNEAQVEAARARLRSSESALIQQRQTTAAAVAEARSNVQSARVRLAAARESARVQPNQTNASVASAEATVRSSRANLASAQESLRLLQSATQPQAAASAQAQLAQAKVNFENANTEYQRQQRLFDKGFAARNAVETAQNSLEAARATLATAQTRLDTLKDEQNSQTQDAQARVAAAQANLQGAIAALEQARQGRVNDTLKRADVQTAAASLHQAEAGLRTALANQKALDQRAEDIAANRASLRQSEAALQTARVNTRQVAIRRSSIVSQRAQLSRAQEQASNALRNLQQTTVVAQSAGVVLKKYVDVGAIIQSGESGFSGGTSIVQLANTERVYVDAQVDEADISNVRVGQRVSVVLDAYPDAPRTGRVRKIFPQAEVEQNVTYVKVQVQIDKADADLRPQLNATCDFVLQELKNASITVPTEAIREEAGKSYVLVVKDLAKPASDKENQEKRFVTIGLRGDERTQILKGLKPGETVIKQVLDTTLGPLPGGPGG